MESSLCVLGCCYRHWRERGTIAPEVCYGKRDPNHPLLIQPQGSMVSGTLLYLKVMMFPVVFAGNIGNNIRVLASAQTLYPEITKIYCNANYSLPRLPASSPSQRE